MKKSKKNKPPISKNSPNAETLAAFNEPESDVPYDPNDEASVKEFWDDATVHSGKEDDYEKWKIAHIKEGLARADLGEFVPESQWRKTFKRGK